MKPLSDAVSNSPRALSGDFRFACPLRCQLAMVAVLPGCAAVAGKRRSFWQFRAPISRNDGRLAIPARRFRKKTVVWPNPRADSPKRPSFGQIRRRISQNDCRFIESARRTGKKAVVFPSNPRLAGFLANFPFPSASFPVPNS